MIQSTDMGNKQRSIHRSYADEAVSTDLVQNEETARQRLTFRVARRLGSFHSVTAFLDALILLHQPVVKLWLRRMRWKNPGASPKELVEALDGYLKATVTAGGIGVAAGLAVPGMGRAKAIALGAGQAVTVAEATALYTSARVHAYGIEDRDTHRQLLLAGLLGKKSIGDTVKVPEAKLRHLFPVLIASLGAADLSRGVRGGTQALVSRKLSAHLPKKLSRRAPVIAGAAIGGTVSAEAADQILARMEALFGPPPLDWPEPEVIDVVATGESDDYT